MAWKEVMEPSPVELIRSSTSLTSDSMVAGYPFSMGILFIMALISDVA